MTYEYQQYLAHYGVKGQQWGKRQWQYEDGTYTQEGKERYWGGGHGHQRGQNMQQTSPQQRMARQQTVNRRQTLNPERRPKTAQEIEAEKEARKQKRNKIIAVAAGVTLAAIAGYALYRHGTKARRNEIKDIRNARMIELTNKRAVLDQKTSDLVSSMRSGKISKESYKAQIRSINNDYKSLWKQQSGRETKKFAKSVYKNYPNQKISQDWMSSVGLNLKRKHHKF